MDGSFSLAIPYFYIAHLLLISMRVGAALLFAPLWGHPGIPQPMRVLLVFTISLGIASVTPFSPQAYSNPGLVIPSEILIGLLLSMGIRIAFAGLHMGGQFISYHLGFSAVQVIDPQTQNRSTLMSAFLTLFGYMMILTTDQHHNILRAITISYETFPIGTVVKHSQWFEALMQAASQIFVIGWKIALPVFVATFLVEVTVAFVSRMQPQINAMVVTAPLKLLIGISVFGASLAFLPRAIGAIIDTPILRK
jgi:flagellar biosynthesis protein FliR